MIDGQYFSHLRSKLKLLRACFVIFFVIMLRIYQSASRQGLFLIFSVEKVANKYNLVEKYEQETLLDFDPPYKRILFWNDVRNFQLSQDITI